MATLATEPDVRAVLLEILEVARRSERRGSGLTLIHLLRAYEEVLPMHGIKPQEDAHIYRILLQSSEDRDSSYAGWKRRLSARKATPQAARALRPRRLHNATRNTENVSKAMAAEKPQQLRTASKYPRPPWGANKAASRQKHPSHLNRSTQGLSSVPNSSTDARNLMTSEDSKAQSKVNQQSLLACTPSARRRLALDRAARSPPRPWTEDPSAVDSHSTQMRPDPGLAAPHESAVCQTSKDERLALVASIVTREAVEASLTAERFRRAVLQSKVLRAWQRYTRRFLAATQRGRRGLAGRFLQLWSRWRHEGTARRNRMLAASSIMNVLGSTSAHRASLAASGSAITQLSPARHEAKAVDEPARSTTPDLIPGRSDSWMLRPSPHSSPMPPTFTSSVSTIFRDSASPVTYEGGLQSCASFLRARHAIIRAWGFWRAFRAAAHAQIRREELLRGRERYATMLHAWLEWAGEQAHFVERARACAWLNGHRRLSEAMREHWMPVARRWAGWKRRQPSSGAQALPPIPRALLYARNHMLWAAWPRWWLRACERRECSELDCAAAFARVTASLRHAISMWRHFADVSLERQLCASPASLPAIDRPRIALTICANFLSASKICAQSHRQLALCRALVQFVGPGCSMGKTPCRCCLDPLLDARMQMLCAEYKSPCRGRRS